MEKIIWKDEFSVGVDQFDSQHKHLFEIINKLATQSNTGPDLNLVTETLKEMCNYAQEHFKDEENLMQQYDYPEIEPQRKQHAYFLKTTKELCEYPREQKEVSTNEIAEFLNIWWINHILRFDMKYKKFFQEKLAAVHLKITL